jgi:hypothetical protein
MDATYINSLTSNRVYNKNDISFIGKNLVSYQGFDHRKQFHVIESMNDFESFLNNNESIIINANKPVFIIYETKNNWNLFTILISSDLNVMLFKGNLLLEDIKNIVQKKFNDIEILIDRKQNDAVQVLKNLDILIEHYKKDKHELVSKFKNDQIQYCNNQQDIDKAKNTFRRLLSQFQVIDEYKEKKANECDEDNNRLDRVIDHSLICDENNGAASRSLSNINIIKNDQSSYKQDCINPEIINRPKQIIPINRTTVKLAEESNKIESKESFAAHHSSASSLNYSNANLSTNIIDINNNKSLTNGSKSFINQRVNGKYKLDKIAEEKTIQNKLNIKNESKFAETNESFAAKSSALASTSVSSSSSNMNLVESNTRLSNQNQITATIPIRIPLIKESNQIAEESKFKNISEKNESFAAKSSALASASFSNIKLAESNRLSNRDDKSEFKNTEIKSIPIRMPFVKESNQIAEESKFKNVSETNESFASASNIKLAESNRLSNQNAKSEYINTEIKSIPIRMPFVKESNQIAEESKFKNVSETNESFASASNIKLAESNRLSNQNAKSEYINTEIKSIPIRMPFVKESNQIAEESKFKNVSETNESFATKSSAFASASSSNVKLAESNIRLSNQNEKLEYKNTTPSPIISIRPNEINRLNSDSFQSKSEQMVNLKKESKESVSTRSSESYSNLNDKLSDQSGSFESKPVKFIDSNNTRINNNFVKDEIIETISYGQNNNNTEQKSLIDQETLSIRDEIRQLKESFEKRLKQLEERQFERENAVLKKETRHTDIPIPIHVEFISSNVGVQLPIYFETVEQNKTTIPIERGSKNNFNYYPNGFNNSLPHSASIRFNGLISKNLFQNLNFEY